MKADAKAQARGRPKPGVDLRDHCELLKLTAQNDDDVALLTALYRAIAFGEGEIIVRGQDESRGV